MHDYSEAFKQGLEAGKRQAKDREAVTAVFWDFAEALGKLTDGQLKVSLKPKEMPPERSSLDSLTGGLLVAKVGTLGGRSPRPSYLAIVAEANVDGKVTERELASWATQNGGYPVRVAWNKKEESCNDTESLVRCLEKLVKSSTTGEKLLALIQSGGAAQRATGDGA